jgi:NADPH:quinone reductase-like Zn-dependent oxidoreductase
MDAVSRRARQLAVGDPASVVALEQVPVPVPTDGEIVVELVAAPINPAEILMLQGAYGYGPTVPPLPRDLGIEGVGRVVGGATEIVPVGTLVSLIGAGGIFGDYTVLPAGAVVRVPEDIDAEMFALTFVNIQSVLLMLTGWDLAPGTWVIQNAANSGYGRLLDAVAEQRGIHVVNVVRSASAREEIVGTARGPVVVDGDDLCAAVLAATGGQHPRVAVDAIGGGATGRLAETLEKGGLVVMYGLLSGESPRVDTRLIVFHGIRLEGFWMPHAIAAAAPDVRATLVADAVDVMRTADVTVPVVSRYPLSEVGAAIAHAARGARGGKVLVTR